MQVIRPDDVHAMTREQLVAFYTSKIYLTPKLKAEIKRRGLKPLPTRRVDMVQMLVNDDVNDDVNAREEESDDDTSD